MTRAHTISIVQGKSDDGDARFRPRCSCGWSAPRSAGANAADLAGALADAHLTQASDADGPAEVWIGLVELVARPESELFGEESGAMTSVLVSAHGFVEFVRKIEASYDELGIDVLEFSDVERVRERDARVELSDELRGLADDAEESGAVKADSYYLYPRDDDPGASILVENQAGIDEVVEKVERFVRGWLAGALDRDPAGVEIGDIGVAIENREPAGVRFDVGYAASASELEQHAGLFRAAVRLAEEHGNNIAP